MSKVNHPPHYNTGVIEVIDAIEDWKLGFHLGNVVKYVSRAPHKGNEAQDLKKACWYLIRRMEALGIDPEFTSTKGAGDESPELALKAQNSSTEDILFGFAMRCRRIGCRLFLRDVEEMTGVSRDVIQEMEFTGQISDDALQSIAAAYEIQIEPHRLRDWVVGWIAKM